MLRQVVDYYHQTLKQESEAQAYLAKRGLDDIALIDRFTLGYANRTLGLTLPQKTRKAGAEIRSQLERIGIYRDTGREHFNGSLVIPVINEQGLIQEVYGRKLLDNLRKGTPKHIYLPGSHEGVFNVTGLKNTEEVILCESLIDALTFWRWGFTHVTASYGINGFTEELQQCFIAHKIKRVLIAYDRDDAGNHGAIKVAEQLSQCGVDCLRILFPQGMDANQYACQMSPPQKSLALIIKKAERMGSDNKPPQPSTLSADVKHRDDFFSLAAKEKTTAAEITAVVEPSTAIPPLEIPSTPSHTIEAEVSDHEIKITLGQRLYRVRGLQKNTHYEQLKINLRVSQNEAVHVDQLELYSAKARQNFIKQASTELDVKEEIIKKDLGKILLKLEALQDEKIKNTLEKQAKKEIILTNEEHQQALDLLKSPQLIQQILSDFERCGIVGESINKQVGYLAAVSRKLESPLAVMVQSSSAAGKSALMESVLAFMPEEERIQYSAMTGQALFYMGEKDLKHKILAIAEEEGASTASYALKLLQSEGQVSIASTGKNATTGNLETQEYKVEGPVMLFSTTTAIDLDEELLNRCIILSVDESREQTRAIHRVQRERRTQAGQRARKDKKKLIKLHQNAQRLLKSLDIRNPYVHHLTFLDDKTRMRRDHEKYLGLIDSITLLHQYQREIVQDDYEGEISQYVVVTLDDVELANTLAHEILGRTLDELPPQTRRLLTLMTEMVQTTCEREGIEQSDYRFSRKQIRHDCGWTDFQVKKHMHRLEELEYVLVHSGSRGKSIVYELLYNGEGEEGDNFLMGLLDVNKLRYDEQKNPLSKQKKPPSSPQVVPKKPPSSTEENTNNTINIGLNAESAQNSSKSTYRENHAQTLHRNRKPISLAAKSVN